MVHNKKFNNKTRVNINQIQLHHQITCASQSGFRAHSINNPIKRKPTFHRSDNYLAPQFSSLFGLYRHHHRSTARCCWSQIKHQSTTVVVIATTMRPISVEMYDRQFITTVLNGSSEEGLVAFFTKFVYGWMFTQRARKTCQIDSVNTRIPGFSYRAPARSKKQLIWILDN